MNYSSLNPSYSYNANLPYNTTNIGKDSKMGEYLEIRDSNMFDKYSTEYSNSNYNLSKNILKGIINETEVGKVFFSKDNIKRIQRKLREEIFRRSEGRFKLEEDQDENDLSIVMKYIYTEYGKFLPTHIVRQVKELNNKTVDYIAPDMMTNIKQYHGYLLEINKPLQPMMRPVNVNNAGRRTLPSFTTIYE